MPESAPNHALLTNTYHSSLGAVLGAAKRERQVAR